MSWASIAQKEVKEVRITVDSDFCHSGHSGHSGPDKSKLEKMERLQFIRNEARYAHYIAIMKIQHLRNIRMFGEDYEEDSHKIEIEEDESDTVLYVEDEVDYENDDEY